MKLSTKIIGGLAIVLIGIQFFRIDKSAPEIDQSKDILTLHEASKEVTQILKNACYDCHSYKTEYPWYTNVSPVSWWVKYHINDARKHLNFSEWGNYELKRKKHKLKELIEEIEGGEMPLNSYAWVHDEAKLSAKQREALIVWAKNTTNKL
jgi:hypothetical protein